MSRRLAAAGPAVPGLGRGSAQTSVSRNPAAGRPVRPGFSLRFAAGGPAVPGVSRRSTAARRASRISAAAAVLCLGACAVGPDYARPDLDTPAAFRNPAADGAAFANLPWWTVFEDPALSALIETALAGNRDLAAAAARIDEARARLGVSRAGLWPEITGGVQGGRGENQALGAPGVQERWVLGASLAWEIDLWGRLRRLNEAARGELLATEWARRAVTLALVADVAGAYLLLQDLDARIGIAIRTLESREDTLGIIRARFEQGTVPLLDVNQAEIQAAEAEATLAALRRDAGRTENLLAVLLGRNPGPIPRGPAPAVTVGAPAVPAGLPLELLDRRPDVRRAEAQLAAQTARIGAAQALRLPTLALTASGGLVSSDVNDLLDSDDDLWSLAGGLVGPLFDAGRRRRNVEAERARTLQFVAAYEQAVLQALREVEDALIGLATLGDEAAARERQVAAARSALSLSQARYDGGVTSYLEVLDSERALFQAELAASVVRRQRRVAFVDLYRALGGGWQLPEDPGNPAAASTAAPAAPAAASTAPLAAPASPPAVP